MHFSLWHRFRHSDASSARVQNASRAKATRPARRLSLEPLENRIMLSGGIVETDVSSGNDYCDSGAITSNGALLCAGSQDSRANVAITRHLSTGVLDTSFDGDGKVSF